MTLKIIDKNLLMLYKANIQLLITWSSELDQEGGNHSHHKHLVISGLVRDWSAEDQ